MINIYLRSDVVIDDDDADELKKELKSFKTNMYGCVAKIPKITHVWGLNYYLIINNRTRI